MLFQGFMNLFSHSSFKFVFVLKIESDTFIFHEVNLMILKSCYFLNQFVFHWLARNEEPGDEFQQFTFWIMKLVQKFDFSLAGAPMFWAWAARNH